MKKIIKITAILLLSLLMISTLASCGVLENILNSATGNPNPGGDDIVTSPHTCRDVCDECGKCTNGDCDDSVCSEKCQGHQENHTCQDVCDECGKCTNGDCDDPFCAEKCQGHQENHTCQDVCDECGKCTNGDCDDSVCAEKCQGHQENHTCQDVCDECGKCQNNDCDEPVCAEKCSKNATYAYMPIISEVMPAIYINTPDNSNDWATQYGLSDKNAGNIDYVDATVSVVNCETEYEMNGVAAEVKVRGNYTLEYPKKPIRIKFSQKKNMLGLHDGEKYKNWVLLADWKDLSMSNNTLAFYLGNTILGSDGYYCTDFRNVEVYLNNQYWGVYLLVEQQEVKDDRTSVPEVEDDYTGNDIGYFFEYDGYYYIEKQLEDGDPTFEMNYNGAPHRNDIGYTISSDIYADSQIEFIKNYMNNAFYIAYQANYFGRYYKFNDDYTGIVAAPEITSAYEAVSAVIDVQSLVDMYILHELVCDPDVDWSSFYISVDMTTDGNKKITFEAPWDFDSCFGIRSGYCNDAQGMFAMNSNNPWFRLVYGQEWFNEMVCEKWAEIKYYGVFDNAISLIETQKATYQQYYVSNYQKWTERLNGNGECIGLLNSYNDANTAQGLAADYLINWFTKRVAYLDSQWGEHEPEVEIQIPENAVAYRYEAESGELEGFSSQSPIRTNKSYASESSYVGDVNAGSSITFTVTADNAATVYLYAGVSKLSSVNIFSNCFSLTVNDEVVTLPYREVPAISNGEEEWHTFISVQLVSIDLVAGENTITFTALTGTTNFDYIEIYSEDVLS